MLCTMTGASAASRAKGSLLGMETMVTANASQLLNGVAGGMDVVGKGSGVVSELPL